MRANDKNYMRIKKPVAVLILILCLGIASVISTGCAISKDNDPDKDTELSEEEGGKYMSYEGPILPLTTIGDAKDIEVERELCFDFQPMGSGKSSRGAVPFLLPHNVKDSYIITNDTGETRQVRLCYPSSGKISYTANFMPYMTVDGERVDTEMFAGQSLSQFYAAGARSDEEKIYSVTEFTSWKQYKELLDDGEYFKDALDKNINLDKPVTVYQLSNEAGASSDANGATLALEFTSDDNNTEVLTYGINLLKDGGSDGNWKVGYSMPQNSSGAFRAARYLIAVGNDIGDYKIRGYKDGTCTAGTEVEISADVNRYETTLGKILQEILKYHNSIFNNKTDVKTILSEISSENLASLIEGYIRLDEKIAGEEPEGAKYFPLEDAIGQTMATMRMFYQTFSVEIPANGSVKIEAIMYKNPSQNNKDGDKSAEKAYDLVTQLGSDMKFASQKVVIDNYESIEITKDNCEFDLKNNIACVTLDQGKEYFFIEVKDVSQ